jgi:hypothetical protein
MIYNLERTKYIAMTRHGFQNYSIILYMFLYSVLSRDRCQSLAPAVDTAQQPSSATTMGGGATTASPSHPHVDPTASPTASSATPLSPAAMENL